jgi:hypothetical protein
MVARRPVSSRMAKQLLADGRTPVFKGFKNRDGKDFSAGLRWDAEAGRVAFWFPERGSAPSKLPPPRAEKPAYRLERLPPVPQLRPGDPCPACGKGRIIQGKRALGCDRWKAGCRFVVD